MAADFPGFLTKYQETLQDLFSVQHDIDSFSQERGLPEGVMTAIRECSPLSAVIPSEFGGRGGRVSEFLSVLESSSYHSLALSLTFGINGALFLQPLTRYGTPELKTRVFADFVSGEALGGLMITEPDFGSDALSMQTFYEQTPAGFDIEGIKHWGGLTGWARYWLLTARRRNDDGTLARDIDFFVCDTNSKEQEIVVEELYPNLGLYMIPYGRNRISVSVPDVARLEPETTGIKMLLDTLHRSRVQFPGMGMGYLRRIVDDAVAHCKSRYVGGKSLLAYDQVKQRVATLQSYYTTCSAMCLYSSENAQIDKNQATCSVQANSVKALVTDYMQNAAQSLVQLMGANGYRIDRFAGRAIIDSRPFQIFEGSNDILYQQISESFLKEMRRAKESNLYRHLSEHALTKLSADRFKSLLSFDVDSSLPQRKLVELGRVLARVVSMDFVVTLGERGFRSDLIAGCLDTIRTEIESIVARLSGGTLEEPTVDYLDGSAWLDFVVAR